MALMKIFETGSLAIVAGTLGFASPALAQPPAAPPTVAPAPALALGDADPLAGFSLSLPIRLSLLGRTPVLAGYFPNCDSREEAAGNSVGGIPLQRAFEWRPLRGLYLNAFSRLGCPIDAGIGGSVTYAVPLRGSFALAFSTGLFLAPGQLPLLGGPKAALARGLAGAPSPMPTAARIDLGWVTRHGQLLAVGVELIGRRFPRVLFSGSGF